MEQQQRAESTSCVTLRQSSVNHDPTSTANCYCDAAATTKSFGSPGVSKLVGGRSRPLMPLRRSRHFERSWSPDLSCFRQPRSPDAPDAVHGFARSCSYAAARKIGEEDSAGTSSLSRSRLLRRLLFNGRITESAGKLPGLSTTDGLSVGNFDDSAAGVDCSAGNSVRTDRNKNRQIGTSFLW